MGEQLVYEDTFEQALAKLSAGDLRTASAITEAAATAAETARESADGRVRSLAERLSVLRRQAQQLADELANIESEIDR